MRPVFLLALALGLCTAGGCGMVRPTTSVTTAIDGTYRLEKNFNNGAWLDANVDAGFEMVIEAGTVRVLGEQWRDVQASPIKTDPSKVPATIDFLGGVEIRRGIYKLEGDQLTIVTGNSDGEDGRPKNFAPVPGVAIEVYRRK